MWGSGESREENKNEVFVVMITTIFQVPARIEANEKEDPLYKWMNKIHFRGI